MPCPFNGPKMFCAGPNVFSHSKNFYTYCCSHKHFCHTKRWFAVSKIGFCASTKLFEEALNAFKFLGRQKTFGPAQNILGPVKGQGICLHRSWRQFIAHENFLHSIINGFIFKEWFLFAPPKTTTNNWRINVRNQDTSFSDRLKELT